MRPNTAGRGSTTSASGALGQKRECNSLSNQRHDVRTARHLQVRGWGETISRLAPLSTDGDSALPSQIYADTKGNPLVETCADMLHVTRVITGIVKTSWKEIVGGCGVLRRSRTLTFKLPKPENTSTHKQLQAWYFRRARGVTAPPVLDATGIALALEATDLVRGKKVVVAQDIDICTGVTYTDYVYGKYARTSGETHAIIAIPEGTCMVARSIPLVALRKIDRDAHDALRDMVANANVPVCPCPACTAAPTV